MKFLKNQFIFLVFIIISNTIVSQQNSQADLKKKRSQIQNEIKQINELLFSNNKKKSVAFSDIENLNIKIKRKEELVKLVNQQINILTTEIDDNSFSLDSLTQSLENSKESYKNIIVKSYKTKSGKSRLMFLLSSETFFQAYKRVQYMKQYANFRKKQSINISILIEQIANLNKKLNAQLEDKQDLIIENREIQKSLEKEKKESNSLVFQLRNKEKRYKREIEDKEKLTAQIDKEIERLIKEAIAKSRSTSSSNAFALTPEAKELEKNFILNKGKLPWPVVRGVIIQKFGMQSHPVVKTAKIKSNGIIIATSAGQKVRTVFDGEVLSVLKFKGSNPTVLVRHGNFITAYKNLSKVYVKKGEKVFSSQDIGEVFTNKSSGKSTVQFSVFEKTSPVNPVFWLLKK
ncbi:MAG: peptidase M23 [Flavobacteriales bacterium]|nr:peptidase M23 [Flavobacteriales bacterium]MBK56469.1 peptidase M23 [Flavobacteriaceae bacterium]|tara:strand:+ start:230 stop:1438 length:1209 start_codon:yes stop_codon:yes gene_type:complete